MISESARLSRIRDQLAAIAPGEWTRVHDDKGCFAEARGPMGELLPVLRFHSGASEDEIAFIVDAPDNMRFLLSLVDRAIARLRPALPENQKEPDPKDYAAECAMKCAEPAFRAFLEQQHGLERPLTDERVAQKVRGLLGVTSRAELNDDGHAAARWTALRGDFDAWCRAWR
jgi:hypothetical protein